MRFFLVISLFFLSLSLVIPSVGMANPPPWAPAHGYRAKQQYWYYPGQQVYYNPLKKGYHYQDNGEWLFGVKLPSRIKLGKKVSIDLDANLPYTQHPYVIKQYPGPKGPKGPGR